jgi:hypothetical protein
MSSADQKVEVTDATLGAREEKGLIVLDKLFVKVTSTLEVLNTIKTDYQQQTERINEQTESLAELSAQSIRLQKHISSLQNNIAELTTALNNFAIPPDIKDKAAAAAAVNAENLPALKVGTNEIWHFLTSAMVIYFINNSINSLKLQPLPAATQLQPATVKVINDGDQKEDKKKGKEKSEGQKNGKK